MVFNENGDICEMEKEFKKLELCTAHGLLPRDLRTIDSSFGGHVSSILVRKHAIVLHLGHIRCIIKADMMLLIGAPGMDASHQSAFVYELQGKLKSRDSPFFEHRALEAVLQNVINELDETKEALLPPIEHLLESLAQHVDRDKLLELLEFRRRITKFENKVTSLRETIQDLLNNDEDLAESYLTENNAGRPRQESDHLEIEFLLEHYMKRIDEIAYTITEASNGIASTQLITNMILASQRNQLLLFEIKITLATMALSSVAAVASIFGMNIQNGLEGSHPSFYAVVGLNVCVAAFLYLATTSRMRRMSQSTGFKISKRSPLLPLLNVSGTTTATKTT
ncbi:hypothetical protein SmJEL517_g05730 [Synchytrium microbalum]|uniref:Magnesium transporter n=1 Tax=Synchytrium microbalum TaxID=1806994 RepID=A0A507BTZ8_9FUNG|nr:uncharacterized protein SmJEL517_g05730 [Synchytrium microbalum]TPX30788.1 hypothetical protein SmJEL517_g05730 [Synchytrium microbalum]